MDGSELQGAPVDKAKARHLIRRATLDDVPWMVEIARGLFSHIDGQATADTLSLFIQSPNVLILRGEQSAIGVYWYQWPYNPKLLMAEDLFIGSSGDDVWELLAIFGELTKILRNLGVIEFKFDLSDFSKAGKSLDPFAKRLGATIDRPTYRINLKTLH